MMKLPLAGNALDVDVPQLLEMATAYISSCLVGPLPLNDWGSHCFVEAIDGSSLAFPGSSTTR